MEECSHIQHLTLPSGWTSSSVSASINASFATIDNNTRAVLGSQYDAFRPWVQNWEQREEQYQKQWFEEQVRLINTEGGPRGQEGRQPVPPRLPEERTNYDRRERSVEEIRMADPNPTDRPTTTDIAQGNTLDSVPESGILGVPLRQQEYVYYCGPASAQELLDYEWGYTGSSSKYSQSTLATYMQTDPVNGTYVYKVTDGLNYYKDPNKSPLSTWNSGYIYSDETTTATTLYDDTKQAVSQENHGVVYRVNTCPLPGQSDVWGEPYGLVGYYDSGSGNYSSLIHYVAGRGYTTYSNGRHRVTYLDSYNHAYAWGNPYGYQILDTRNMASCVNAAGSYPGWIIW
jgi:hypothetical protein